MGYEGPYIYRAPYGNADAVENFENTVLEGISESRVTEFKTDPPAKDGIVRLWGTKPSNDGTWGKINPDDYLIFYRDGTYTYVARIIDTEINEGLARNVWPNFGDDDPWDRIIYLDEPNEIAVPSAQIHDYAGYDIDYVMGFSSLNDMGIGGIRAEYGSVEAFAEGRETSESADIDVQRDVEPAIARVDLDGLYFPDDRLDEIVTQINSALSGGKHVIFTGPPGTGKTEIARQVANSLVDSHPDLYTGSQMTTATSDWSTFETVGGYMPTESSEENLSFEAGQVLRRFKQANTQQNELLVIDEINRADIDKAFGQLFTLLSGQAVQLPYRIQGEEIEIRPAAETDGDPAFHEYVMPESWRILATMNTYDKTSLYELSYAFMRRFSFIHVDAPTIPKNDSERIALLEEYTDLWGISQPEEVLDAVSEVWFMLNGPQSTHKIGPAIVQDILRGIEFGHHRTHEMAVTTAVGNYVLPQLEGVPRREAIVDKLSNVDAVDRHRLAELSRDILQIEIEIDG